MSRLRLIGFYLLENAKMLDQLLNSMVLGFLLLVWSLFTGQEGEGSYADETLSARAGRSLLAGKVFGKLLAPLIDLLFRWQDKTITLPDGSTLTHDSHCVRAYWKKYHKLGLPREYREARR